MAEALVSIILAQLDSVIPHQKEKGIALTAGAEQEVGKLKSNLVAIQDVLADAEIKQVKDTAARDWLNKLEDTSYDVDDVLDEWNTMLHKVENSPKCLEKVCSHCPGSLCRCMQFIPPDAIVVKIKNQSRKLEIIVSEKDKFNSSPIRKGREEELERRMNTEITGLTEVYKIHDELKNELMDCLLNEAVTFISIVGIRGVGKTTLAQRIFLDDRVKSHFDKRIWVCVSNSIDEIMIAKAIFESLTNKAPDFDELEIVLQHIYQHIEGNKQFLLVLDNVCTANWNRLKHFLVYSSQYIKILITTRIENVVNISVPTREISLGPLSDDNSRSFFSEVVGCEKFVEVAKKIVQKCNGLPLALKMLGGLLCFKNEIEEWQNVLDSEIWELNEVEIGFFLPLLLSYYNLPPILKKCFQYCATFPKDYNIKKDQLIKSWMAQDYLRMEQDKDMESVGKKYFEILAKCSFFQDFQIHEFDESIKSFKMHGVVYEFARFLTKNERVDNLMESKSKSSFKKALHLMMGVQPRIPFSSSIYREQSLRSLVVECQESTPKIVLSELFDKLTCLRELDLSDCSITEVPIKIKNLMHLRSLNLSQNKNLQKLPETLCELHNLKILDVGACYRLEKLPLRIEKLTNLRHLINHETSITSMPEGFQKLTCLRTITKFAVSIDKDGEKTCKLADLGNMTKLEGSLIITGLGNLGDIGDVEKAKLQEKKLFRLGLRFNGSMYLDDEDILKKIKPPPGLRELMIQYYIGRTLSPDVFEWLDKLTVLRLSFCLEFKSLPALGKLSSLESLYISNMSGVRNVGNEFLGIESSAIVSRKGKKISGRQRGDTSTSSDIVSPEGKDNAFPRLKTLAFEYMHAWEKWEDSTTLSCLHSLTIGYCSKLEHLPNSILETPTLEKLEINFCTVLTENYKKGGNFYDEISHIPSIKIDGKEVTRTAGVPPIDPHRFSFDHQDTDLEPIDPHRFSFDHQDTDLEPIDPHRFSFDNQDTDLEPIDPHKFVFDHQMSKKHPSP